MENDRVEGEKTWHSVNGQLIEFAAFLRTMLTATLRFARKNAVPFTLCALLGLGAGYAVAWFKPVTYTGSMTLSFYQLEKKLYGDAIAELNNALHNHTAKALSGFDSLPDEAIASIVAVEGQNIKGKDLRTDLSVGRVPFYVVVTAHSTAHFPAIEKAIVVYLDSPHFVQERLAHNDLRGKQDKAYYKERMRLLDRQLDEVLDINPMLYESISKELAEAMTKLREAEDRIIFNRNIEVMSGLKPNSAQQNNSMRSFMAMGFAAGLVVAVLWAGLRRNTRHPLHSPQSTSSHEI